MNQALAAEGVLRFRPSHPTGGLVDIGGETFYRIENQDAMPPFLMSLVSDSDHWMFVSSTGALTAGRRDADHALFPYETDDRIHDSRGRVGGKAVIRAPAAGRRWLWEPFSDRYQGLYQTTRSLAKSVLSNRLVFEEVNHDLGLSYSATWMTSERYGFIRRSSLANITSDTVELEILDGIQNVLPDGLTRRFLMEFSTLADGYKENELDPATGLGLFRLSSVPTDRAEPSEALRATAVWSEGLEARARLLSTTQLDRFREGLDISTETLVRGCRGAYLTAARMTLPGGGSREWSVVADVAQDAAAVAATVRLLQSGADPRTLIDQDVARGTRNLLRIVAAADGLQATGDDLSSSRHLSNALFNTMRGGVPERGYQVSRSDFAAYLAAASAAVASRQAGFVDSLPEALDARQLVGLASRCHDPDLERLAGEYLPLAFSRRHGDPSRPWNVFSIDVKSPDGRRTLTYQGNWRDIFQNWEALSLSFPGYIEAMIFKFLNASTADGHNPYRITRDGFDWEVPDPGSPWSQIGYWGDHQVVYLLRLLEASDRYHPAGLSGLLGRRIFSYADLPYRIRPYSDFLRDPRHTIDFDPSLDRRIRERAERDGADGKLLPSADGEPCRANLAEKLIVVALARLFNLVPEAGVWMNTQRPEWNDGNNALVGSGASVVTLCHLRRFLAFCRTLFGSAGAAGFEFAAEIGDALRRVSDILERHTHLLGGAISDRDRRGLLDALGAAGTEYRARLYAAGLAAAPISVGRPELAAFCDLALRHVDHSIRANRRDDGLYHAYNLIRVGDGGISIRRLPEMLEGQVAALSSGALPAAECAALLGTLRQSRLYRPDQDSYLLYPDHRLPGFFAKNQIPEAGLSRSTTLALMVESGDRRVVVRDVGGRLHFNADLRNAEVLAGRLAEIGVPEADRTEVLALYEEVFDHQSFTGRSGTFYKYEGLGCIYWHMVSKLLVAVQEIIVSAQDADAEPAVIERLRSRYAELREGLGVHKPPDRFGAMPTDPYSHTPGFAGAQQPGMTGQTKEDLITRLGEMGLRVEGGRLRFRAELASRDEFLGEARTFRFVDVGGQDRELELDPGTLAFTTCQVPVVAHRSGPARIEVAEDGGSRRSVPGLSLDPQASREIFERTGRVRRLDVFWGFD
ncbi:MAG TPA: hypothetical protein VEK76_10080 [Candidatus Binatia bacterium]|nr:hypothetical protein [Candidatus Binatia bacterium]